MRSVTFLRVVLGILLELGVRTKTATASDSGATWSDFGKLCQTYLALDDAQERVAGEIEEATESVATDTATVTEGLRGVATCQTEACNASAVRLQRIAGHVLARHKEMAKIEEVDADDDELAPGLPQAADSAVRVADVFKAAAKAAATKVRQAAQLAVLGEKWEKGKQTKLEAVKTVEGVNAWEPRRLAAATKSVAAPMTYLCNVQSTICLNMCGVRYASGTKCPCAPVGLVVTLDTGQGDKDIKVTQAWKQVKQTGGLGGRQEQDSMANSWKTAKKECERTAANDTTTETQSTQHRLCAQHSTKCRARYAHSPLPTTCASAARPPHATVKQATTEQRASATRAQGTPQS
ncbi:hypothetical protein ERJ75_001554300 [Trypanosoma vivax]|nr:hypothetical protein TRVL_03521 [Trypanosoma vivax]KAH8606060.1 hypothetical protein ERJ75_001554300 [Trypanosoma vivax]